VLEDGAVTRTESGSPQGGVVSPILANIFLHTVLDVWFHLDVRPRLRGRAHLVRYADDAAMLFEYEEDARRVMAVLPERFGAYGLTLHPEKTRLVAFKRPDAMALPRGDDDGSDGPDTFDFLGCNRSGVGLSGSVGSCEQVVHDDEDHESWRSRGGHRAPRA
jgi:hypothetical protein